MATTWAADLCAQWRALGRVRGKRSKVSTTDGKVREDHSLTGRMYRVVWNREKESRQTALDGIHSLCERTNDYVASVLNVEPLVPDVWVDNNVVGDAAATTAATTPVEDAGAGDQQEEVAVEASVARPSSSMVASVVRRAQHDYFAQCDERTRASLCDLCSSIEEGCRGMARMIYRTYADDHATVALLLARMNFAQLVRRRIVRALHLDVAAAAAAPAETASDSGDEDSV